MIEKWADATQPYLRFLFEDNSSKTAGELHELAKHLSPGGAHTGGWLASLICESALDVCPVLMGALLYYNWSGGKIGFQFMPEPADFEGDADGYCFEALNLMGQLEAATRGDPLRILTGDDRAFYESLPDCLTVYRGCGGISPELAGLGVCWTTSRPLAEWFAQRCSFGADRVLMTARVRKKDVRLALAEEREIVAVPLSSRPLICRDQMERPRFVA